MAGSLTVIGGNTGVVLTGLVSVPSAFADSINATLQTLLNQASAGVEGGILGLTNFDVAGGTTFSSPSSVGSTIYEITNTDSLGAITAGSISGAFTIAESVGALVVQAPGTETITGNGSTSIALFGSSSNVDYTVLAGAGSIYAAGGADSISIGASGGNPSYAVYSAGTDTVDFTSGSSSLTAYGTASDTAMLGSANATITAMDNATVSVLFAPLTGGNLDFINGTSNVATVYSGAYTLPGGQEQFATDKVTAFGGAGGGFFVGGFGGGNSLVGGTGDVTLQGANSQDYLQASGADNKLFAGQGTETLIGTSTSGSNSFQLGLTYVGVGTISGIDIVSTEGSGVQSYLLGSGDSTITGSSASGAINVFDLIRNASVGSADYTITNFASINGLMFINDGASSGTSSISSVTTSNVSINGAVTPVTTVSLTDGTEVKFDGVGSPGNLSYSTDTTGTITLSYNPNA